VFHIGRFFDGNGVASHVSAAELSGTSEATLATWNSAEITTSFTFSRELLVDYIGDCDRIRADLRASSQTEDLLSS
jgi:hypothetical protein